MNKKSQNQERRMGNQIMQTLFLGEVEEHEILSIVGKCQNKTSKDIDGLDMYILKKLLTLSLNHLRLFVIYLYNQEFFQIERDGKDNPII